MTLQQFGAMKATPLGAAILTPGFPAALGTLTALLSPDREAKVLAELSTWLNSPDPSIDQLTSISAPCIAITVLHREMGTPLFIDDQLWDAWQTSNAGVSECPACGYRHPRGYSSCVLCGRRTGEPGIWARNRGRMAVMN